MVPHSHHHDVVAASLTSRLELHIPISELSLKNVHLASQIIVFLFFIFEFFLVFDEIISVDVLGWNIVLTTVLQGFFLTVLDVLEAPLTSAVSAFR